MCVIATLERCQRIHYNQPTMVLSSGFNLNSPQYSFDLFMPSYRKALCKLLEARNVKYQLLEQDREWTLEVPAHQIYKLKGQTVVVPSLTSEIIKWFRNLLK